MTLREQKQALRHKAALQMQKLSADFLAKSEDAIFQTLISLPVLQKARTVFCYVSVGKEPNTHRLIEYLLAEGKAVAVPRCQSGGLMDACPLSDFSELLPAPFGLLEPGPATEVVGPERLDLVLAPCVAADAQGGRLGHGGGYYDRFLAKVNCPVLCLCHGPLLLPKIPMDVYDRKMDAVITEDGLIYSSLPV